MTKVEFMTLMRFPFEWEGFGLYSDELYEWQISQYVPGHEEGSEHDRNGAFHWWLRKNPSKDVLIKLLKLTYLDPDTFLGADVRSYIRQASAFDVDVAVFDAGDY